MSEEIIEPVDDHLEHLTCECGYQGADVHHYEDVDATLCDECFSERCNTCENCNNIIWEDDTARDENGDCYCNYCYNTLFVSCHECRNEISRDDCFEVGRHIYCESCFDENYCSCVACNAVISNEDANYRNDGDEGPYCHACFEEPYEVLHNSKFTINKYKRTVGIELEFYSTDRPCLSSFGKLHDDGSLRSSLSGKYPHEFSSHITNGDNLLGLIDEVCSRISDAEGVVDKSCGFHVHFGMSDTTNLQRKNIREWWRVFERVFFGMVSPSRRHNNYCERVSELSDYGWGHNRYTTLNTVAFDKYETYEVRMHQGTLDPTKIKNWILLLLSFFETFMHIDVVDENGDWIDRIVKAKTMNDRELLIFFFQQLDMPMEFRRYCVERIKKFNEEERYFDLMRKQLKLPIVEEVAPINGTIDVTSTVIINESSFTSRGFFYTHPIHQWTEDALTPYEESNPVDNTTTETPEERS